MNEVFEQIRAAAHSIWYRRWVALMTAWGICLAGWLVVALIPNSYESQARIYVQLDDVLAEQIGIAGASKKDIERVRKTLASAVNLDKVVRATRLGEGLTTDRDMEIAVAKLAENVKVVSKEDNLFELSAQVGESDMSDSENARLAQDVVQKLIDIFREENIAGNRGQTADTLVFLDQQLEERKAELEAAEQQRVAFESKHPELIGGTGGLVNKLAASRAELRGVEADLAAAQTAMAAINGQLAGTPRSIVTPGSSAGGARGALMEAQAQLSQLRARGMTDNHPDVVTLRRQVVALQKQAANEPSGAFGTPNPAYSSLSAIQAERQARVQALQGRRAALQADIMAMSADQSSEPAIAAEANRITRDYEVIKKKYDDLLKDREEMKLRGKVESERSSFQFDVIDPPTVPRAPAAPNRPLFLAGVLAMGLAGGAGVAFVVGQLRSTFTTASSLEKAMGLPVVGTISQTFSDADRVVRKKYMRMFAAGMTGLGGLFVILMAAEFIQRGMIA